MHSQPNIVQTEAAAAPHGTGEDELERLRAALAGSQARVRALAQAHADFARAVALDVGGPMRDMLAMTALLERQPLSLDGAHYVRTILQTGRTALRALTEATRPLGARQPSLPAEPAVTSLHEILDELEALWRGREEGRRARVVTACEAPPDLLVLVDAAGLKQVLEALVDEALAAGGGAVEAVLGGRPEGEDVSVFGRVRATGLAIAEGPARRGVSSGALALCREQIEALGGRLTVEPNPGLGATFAFELSLRRGEAIAPEPAVSTAQGALAHVLIVDDNATSRMVAEALCGVMGCTTETADDGVDGVEAVRLRDFDLILMDIRMPRMDGVAAASAIRALGGAAARTPILALTANVDAESARSYIAAGMDAVLEKPIKPDRLFDAVQQALAKRPPGRPAQRASVG